MLETVTMGRKISNKDYKEEAREIQYALFQAQRKIIEKKIPLLIQIAGVSGAGRSRVINLLNEWMDNKFTRTFTFWSFNDVEKARPEEWRYWNRMPGAGETVLFYDTWYSPAIRDRACGKLSQKDYEAKILHYRELEQTLTDSGMVIVKIWLHLDKEGFERIEKKRAKKKELFAYTPYDKKLAEHYDTFIKRAEEVIEYTDTANAPWTLLDAADENYRNIAAAKAIIEAIETAVEVHEVRAKRTTVETKSKKAKVAQTGILSRVDLTKTVSKEDYNEELAKLQAKIRKLSFEAYQKGIATTMVFEGWDAAGKGSTIRRLVAALDARIATVTPVAAPSAEEKAHHYLWRFWKHVPAKGFISIFDRSWYGRVMVERVEKFTPEEDWSRAYSEINTFERRLTDAKQIVMKFWLHISPDEQLRRFKERQETPRKQHKITDEDWRNREKWDDYEVAVEEMLQKTNTETAPWHVVPANSKLYARLFVLRAYVDALKKALKEN